MRERESIRLRRLRGDPEPWTNDPIFKLYSFTNVKRKYDRTSMLLNREFYDKKALHGHPSPVVLLNATLFRYFGKIETARAIGWHDAWDEHTKRNVEIITRDLHKPFTSAYIVPNCGSTLPKRKIVVQVADAVWSGAERILDTNSWMIACQRLCTIFAIGEFMAKEILLDYIHCTKWVPTDWETWTPVGPGAKRGASILVTGAMERITNIETLMVCRHIYEQRHECWEGESLDLTDIQFQLCEYAKYWKAQTGIGRPKKLFRPTNDMVTNGTRRN